MPKASSYFPARRASIPASTASHSSDFLRFGAGINWFASRFLRSILSSCSLVARRGAFASRMISRSTGRFPERSTRSLVCSRLTAAFCSLRIATHAGGSCFLEDNSLARAMPFFSTELLSPRRLSFASSSSRAASSAMISRGSSISRTRWSMAKTRFIPIKCSAITRPRGESSRVFPFFLTSLCLIISDSGSSPSPTIEEPIPAMSFSFPRATTAFAANSSEASSIS